MLSFSIVIFVIFRMVQSEIRIERCLRAKHFKERPEDDSMMKDACDQYSHRTCCSQTFSTAFNDVENGYQKLYGFNISHCGPIQNEKCSESFKLDACAYGCNPYFARWRRQSEGNWKSSNEIYKKIPLCLSDCEQWFEDCKMEKTCVTDWVKDFTWIRPSDSGKRINICPEKSKCETIKQKFGTARSFCEKIWSYMYEIKDDEFLKCFHLKYRNNADLFPAHPYAVYVNYA